MIFMPDARMHIESAIDQITSTQLVTCVATDTLRQIAASVRNADCGSVIMLKDTEIVGIWTESDANKFKSAYPSAASSGISNVMRRPVGVTKRKTEQPGWVKVSGSTTALDALRLLKEISQSNLMVADDNFTLGFVWLNEICPATELEYVTRLKESLTGNRKALESSFRHLELANRVIAASLNSIMITDASGRITSVNPSFTRTTGYSENEVVGRTPAILNSGLHDRQFYRAMFDQVHRNDRFEGEIWNRRKNGEIYAEWLTISAIRDDSGTICQYASIFNDITQQKIMEEENLRLSLTDSLTGLPNRNTFCDRLGMALGHASRNNHKLAVLALSIDNYRQISNALGHARGDEILIQYARRLLGIVRKEDAVARVGEHEFAILLPEVESFDGTQRVIDALTDFSTHSYVVADNELYCTSSIGVSFYPGQADPEELLNSAETAMQMAREAGPNNCRFYTHSMDADSRKRLDMQTLLQAGLHKEEFSLHYQPKIALANNRLVSQEALIRWQNKQLGTIPPTTFVPLAEQLGLIDDISRWVLREACTQNQKWMGQGFGANRMSVNVSTLHLKSGTFVNDVKAILSELEYSPEQLDLEITESVFIEDIDDISRMLKQLRDMGVSIAIDDFGTGYSSLSYLKKIPADLIKIDSSFIKDLHNSRDDQQITQAIIAMAHHLDFDVIAEGVENSQQLELLNEYGCDQVQGFLYGEPLSAGEFLTNAHVMSQVQGPAYSLEV
jgi:diguanylate cyclase (GGDEF)-like protein/PAS domain S-box-containing protein